MSAAGGIGVTMAVAGMGYTAGTLVTSVGNNLFFHDPMPTQNQYLQGLAFTLITAGVMYEIAPPQVNRDTRPIPDHIKTPTFSSKYIVNLQSVDSARYCLNLQPWTKLKCL
jgi:hypothetical protein